MNSDRLIVPGGTPEPAWLAWLSSWPVPTLEETLPSTRLVVVAPHPDDELLACGGLLAGHVQRGGTVMIIAVTDGEASHGRTSAAAAAGLALARRAERLEGLRRLGLQSVQVLRLQLPDGGGAGHGATIAGLLEAVLQPADLIVSTWRLDGHPDHAAAGAACAGAAAVVGCRLLEAPVWMWHWAAPGDPRVPWQRMRCLRLTSEDSSLKLAALAAHTSQLSPRGQGCGPVLDAQILARARRSAEYFFV